MGGCGLPPHLFHSHHGVVKGGRSLCLGEAGSWSGDPAWFNTKKHRVSGMGEASFTLGPGLYHAKPQSLCGLASPAIMEPPGFTMAGT